MEGDNNQMDDRTMMFSKDGKSSEMTIPERIGNFIFAYLFCTLCLED